MNNKLRDYLKKELNSERYDVLHESLKITKTRCTQLQNHPESMTYGEVLLLEKAIDKKDVKAIDLVVRFKCGMKRMNAEEISKLHEKKFGRPLPYLVS